jgi:hypothetical protein
MSQTDQDKATAAHGKIIARAWRDPAFKAKLMADPHGVLKEAGVAVPTGMTVKVVENTDTHRHLVLPPKPTGELSDAELDKVAGGTLGMLVGAVVGGLQIHAANQAEQAAQQSMNAYTAAGNTFPKP